MKETECLPTPKILRSAELQNDKRVFIRHVLLSAITKTNMKTKTNNHPLKKYPIIGACGLDCGLCPSFHSGGDKPCPGCCGEGFGTGTRAARSLHAL